MHAIRCLHDWLGSEGEEQSDSDITRTLAGSPCAVWAISQWFTEGAQKLAKRAAPPLADDLYQLEQWMGREVILSRYCPAVDAGNVGQKPRIRRAARVAEEFRASGLEKLGVRWVERLPCVPRGRVKK